MNNFEYKNLRGEVYKRLKSEPDNEKRREILEKEKDNPEFQEAEKLIRQEKKNSLESGRGVSSSGENNFKDIYIGFLTDPYIDLAINPNCLDATNYTQSKKAKIIETFKLLKEKLHDSTLIDLGSGDPGNFELLYRLVTICGVKKLIGVEKYPTDNKDHWERVMNYLINENEFYKKLREKNQDLKLPEFEIKLNTDMLSFLEKRTAQSNFVMSGIDDAILKNNEYIEKLCENLSRLTPKGGIVIGVASVINNRSDLMKKNGFTSTEINKGISVSNSDYIWEKV